MSFLLRGVEVEDLGSLYGLAKQFVLLNLPAERKVLSEKIATSVAAFARQKKREEAEYLFVAEDIESGGVVGSSQVIAKHGTPDCPHLSFKVLQKDRMSQDLGIGFIHKILRFHEETDGPTEIGGLLVDRGYRRRPEKVGKQISLVRFLYMAMEPQAFSERVLCELTPPLTDEGRSEFWEALGRRFTGLPYQEADQLCQINKDFIRDLFPEEDIYLSLLDSKARLVLGQVGNATRPAQHLLESIGFQYLEEVDPFDGGPHYGCETQQVSIVKQTVKAKIGTSSTGPFPKTGLVGIKADGKFKAVQATLRVEDGTVSVSDPSRKTLDVVDGDEVFVSVLY